MVKASLKLSNGTVVSIEGNKDEILELLELYGGDQKPIQPTKPPKKTQKPTKSALPVSTDQHVPSDDEMVNIINQAKVCPEAEGIEQYVLDQTNEANRVLLPLYIIHEYLDNSFGLTTSEISKLTIELGAKVSRQNALHAIKNAASPYVIGDKPRKQSVGSRYRINRRGLSHLKNVISGSNTD